LPDLFYQTDHDLTRIHFINKQNHKFMGQFYLFSFKSIIAFSYFMWYNFAKARMIDEIIQNMLGGNPK